jgi:hypothetical protein
MLSGMVFPVFGGGFSAEFPEYPVELGKAYKTAFHGNIRDFVLGIGQEELAVANPYQVDILRDSVARDAFELMG